MNVAALSPVDPPAGAATIASFRAATRAGLESEPNLSLAAAPVYQALQSAWAAADAHVPLFVLPPDGGSVLRLYEAVQAIAAERVYPAPVFSFAV
jgi:hypothetical protein